MLIRRSGVNAPPRNILSEPDKRTAERALRDAGLSRKGAKSVLATGYDATFGGDPDLGLCDAGPATVEPQRDAVTDLIKRLKEKIHEE